MAEAAQKLEPVEFDPLALIDADPKPFLVDKEARRDFMDRVREIALTAGDDVSSDKSRKLIIATAAKVTRCKTKLDDAGKALTEKARKEIEDMNAARREIRDDFTQLAAEVRRPVTKWEEAEKEREERVQLTLDELRGVIANPAPHGVTSERLAERIAEVERDTIDPDVFREKTEWGEQLRSDALSALRNTLARVEQEEADRAELERLRKAEQEREEREARERAEREAKEREAAEAKARAEREAAEAKARAEREAAEAKAKAEREEKARREHVESVIEHIKQAGLGFIGGEPQPAAILQYELEEKIVIDDTFGDRKAEAEKARQDALAQVEAAIARGRERAEREAEERREREAERARQEERERIEKERADEVARRKAEQAERDRKARNKRHQREVITAAERAFVNAGLSEEHAKTAVTEIAAGAIPHVSINF